MTWSRAAGLVLLAAAAAIAARWFRGIESPARQDPVSRSEGPQVATTGEPAQTYVRVPLGVLGPEPCGSPTPDGPCGLRLGHLVGPFFPGHGGHLP